MRNDIFYKFLSFLSVTSILLLMQSCSKDGFLNVTPKDKLTDNTFWKTEQDADLALTGLYNNWDKYNNILYMDLITDNGYCQFPWEGGFTMMGNGSLNASNYGTQYFDYNNIRKYNNFLEKIEQIEMDAGKKSIYKAEARFLRAYDYFRKVQFYENIPLVVNTISNPLEAQLAPDPKSKIVDFILNELEEISNILPVANTIESRGHVSSGAALALKARLELYEKMYEEARADAKKVMQMPVYELFPDFRGLFLEENEGRNKESILSIIYIEDTYKNDLWQRILPAKEGGYSSISAVQSIVDAFEMKNGAAIDEPASGYNADKPFEGRDPRLDMTILHPGLWFNSRYFSSLDEGSPDYFQIAAAPRSGYNVLKYSKIVPSSLYNNGGNDIIVIRLAEVLLTFAEAAIESNNINAEVYEAINRVRRRVGMPDVDQSKYNSQAMLRELIRRERRVELAFEGLRYFDIKRWDIGAQVLDGPLYGSRFGSVDPLTGNITWADGRIKLEDRNFFPDRKYLLPIPQSELDANPNITQNLGY